MIFDYYGTNCEIQLHFSGMRHRVIWKGGIAVRGLPVYLTFRVPG
jgi:hypothetical protein